MRYQLAVLLAVLWFSKGSVEKEELVGRDAGSCSSRSKLVLLANVRIADRSLANLLICCEGKWCK